MYRSSVKKSEIRENANHTTRSLILTLLYEVKGLFMAFERRRRRKKKLPKSEKGEYLLNVSSHDRSYNRQKAGSIANT